MNRLSCVIIVLLSVCNVVHAEATADTDEESFFSRTALIERANAFGRNFKTTLGAISTPLSIASGDGNDYQHERSLQLSDDGATALDMESICAVIQLSFQHEVSCTCLGTLTGSFSISCQYEEPICSITATGKTCGIPQIAVSMVEGKIFSATTCVREYTRGILPMEDTCIFVDACPDAEDGFCDCTASYGGNICDTCEVCEGGHALTVDCSNVNWEAVSTECSAVDLDLELSKGAGIIAGFAPTFSGFCSELEKGLNNEISCDCTDAIGGTFSLTCETNEPVCAHENRCGMVKSTVSVVKGELESITACATYDAPFGETCTALQLCDGGICGCVAIYNGERCNSCKVCEGGESVKQDCSNVYEHAVLQQCQAVSASTSYEFLPDYALPKSMEPIGPIGFQTKSSAGRVIGYGAVPVVHVLPAALVVFTVSGLL